MPSRILSDHINPNGQFEDEVGLWAKTEIIGL